MSGNKTLIALSIVIAFGTLGAASVAQASEDKYHWSPQDDDPGVPVPGIHTMPSSHGAPYWHTFDGKAAYDFVPPANHAHHNSKERIRGR